MCEASADHVRGLDAECWHCLQNTDKCRFDRLHSKATSLAFCLEQRQKHKSCRHDIIPGTQLSRLWEHEFVKAVGMECEQFHVDQKR